MTLELFKHRTRFKGLVYTENCIFGTGCCHLETTEVWAVLGGMEYVAEFAPQGFRCLSKHVMPSLVMEKNLSLSFLLSQFLSRDRSHYVDPAYLELCVDQADHELLKICLSLLLPLPPKCLDQNLMHPYHARKKFFLFFISQLGRLMGKAPSGNITCPVYYVSWLESLWNGKMEETKRPRSLQSVCFLPLPNISFCANKSSSVTWIIPFAPWQNHLPMGSTS